MFELCGYCPECNFEILSAESDDLDNLTQSFETRFEVLLNDHLRSDDCR